MFAIILYRALNRTVFLRKKIINGRGRRSYQLKLVATQRKKKHDQLLNVSYRYKFECWFYNLRNPSMTTCHGCNKDTKKKYIHEVTFENVIVNICEDCMKDIPQRMGKPTEPEPLKKVKSAKAGTSGLKGLKNKAAKLQSNLTARFINETSARKPSISINLSSNKSSSEVIDDTPSAISTTPDPIPSTSGSGSTLMG